MNEGKIPKKNDLTVSHGVKANQVVFSTLSLQEKVAKLRKHSAKKKLDTILDDSDPESLVHALLPQELYWAFKEIGPTDAQDLINMASPEQLNFFLDIELWEKDSLSHAKTLEWLGYLLEAGEKKICELVSHLDPELFVLILARDIKVGGGVGELLHDDERTEEWDHSFDNIYFISFKNPKNARMIGAFLDIVFRNENQLFRGLMEGIKNGFFIELEEEAYGFRNGRLADLGFPSREEALSIYSRIDPESFVLGREKKETEPAGWESLLPAPLRQDTILARALRGCRSGVVDLELNYLANNALMAEEGIFADPEAIQVVMERISGYLCIALQFLSGNDEDKTVEILEREPLRKLFQLGNGIVLGLQRKAAELSASDYAAARALNGLREARPRFYRGLDSDRIDGYREFSSMEDIRLVEEFLKMFSDQH